MAGMRSLQLSLRLSRTYALVATGTFHLAQSPLVLLVHLSFMVLLKLVFVRSTVQRSD